MPRDRVLLLAPLLSVVVLLLPALGHRAHASCAPDERPLAAQLAEAPVVFVGTVVDVRHGTTATFEVDEVWAGSVPARVQVFGGPDGPGVASSVDRGWEPGTRYLVVPQVVDDRLTDNSCSSTQPWTDDLEEVRPATVMQPTAIPAGDRGGLPPWALPVGVAIALVGIVAVTAVVTRDRGERPG